VLFAEESKLTEQAESMPALEEPSAPPLPLEPIIIKERLRPECPICMDTIEIMACGPCG